MVLAVPLRLSRPTPSLSVEPLPIKITIVPEGLRRLMVLERFPADAGEPNVLGDGAAADLVVRHHASAHSQRLGGGVQ